MKNIKILFKILIFLVLINCEKKTIDGVWYLQGGNIVLNISLKNNVFEFYEKKDLIMKAKIIDYKKMEEDKIKLKLKKEKIGDNKEYQIKYEGIDEITVWIEKSKDKIKLIADMLSKHPYIFVREDKPNNDFRYLNQYEIDQIKNGVTLKEVQTRYTLKVIPSTESLMKDEEVVNNENSNLRKWIRETYGVNKIIKTMTDYMFDNDPTTFWGSRKYKPYVEIVFKDVKGEDLKDPIKIKAIIFDLGALDKKTDYYKYHRIKDLGLYFSLNTKDSIGSTKSSFNYLKYNVNFTDDISEKGVIFYEGIKAKSILLSVDEIYTGYEDAFAIYDIYIYIESE